MIYCPNDEQFGLMVRVGLSLGSSDVSTKSTIVVSFVASGWGILATVFSVMSFFTVDSAFVLRVILSGGDFAMVDIVLLEGVDIMKSAAEEDAAMIRGFECPGECSFKIRVVFFKAAILALVSLVIAVFRAAETVAFLRMDERFPFRTVLGDFFFLSFIVVVVGRIFVVIGDMSSEEFAARGVAS